MKWFKHTCDSLDDPLIYDLMDEFGNDGYVFFFGFCELYGKEYDHIVSKNPPKYTVKLSFLHQKLKISTQKIKKILLKITVWESCFEDDKVSIFIPKFHELADNYTSYQLQSDFKEPLKKLQNRSRSRLEEDKEKNPPTPLFSNGGKDPNQTQEEILKSAQAAYQYQHEKWEKENKL